MLQSMTGFGRAEYNDENIFIEVEIKSLNSKNTDIRIKNGFLSAQNEMQIRNYITKNLIRGKFDIFFGLKMKNNRGKYSIDSEVFDKYYNQLHKISDKYNKEIEKNDFVPVIMQLPDIMQIEEFDLSLIWEKIYNTFIQATNKLMEFRKQEGQATAEALKTYLKSISENLSRIPHYEDQRIFSIKNKIIKAFDDANINADKERLEAELIFYLEKYDIQEEKIRLANHINYFVQTMDESNSGKKLGFISQEMGREINTLGSKAYHFDIQKIVVQMKDDLEKIKEQVLNIL